MAEIQEQITALRTALNAAEAKVEQLTANQNAGNGVAQVAAYRAENTENTAFRLL